MQYAQILTRGALAAVKTLQGVACLCRAFLSWRATFRLYLWVFVCVVTLGGNQTKKIISPVIEYR